MSPNKHTHTHTHTHTHKPKTKKTLELSMVKDLKRVHYKTAEHLHSYTNSTKRRLSILTWQCFPSNLTYQISLKLFYLFIYLLKKFFNVYLFLREREIEHKWGRSRERGRHRIWSRLQALRCQHRSWWGARTHKL